MGHECVRRSVAGTLLGVVLAGAAALAACSAGSQTSGRTDERRVIASVGDLPRVDYQVGTSSMAVVCDDVAFGALAREVVNDRARLLTTHRFSDERQLRRWYRSIARVCELIPDYASAARYRSLAGDAAEATSLGRMVAEVEAELHTSGAVRGDAAYDERFVRGLRERIRRAPFHAVREELVTWRSAGDIPTVDGIRAAAEAVTAPKLRASNGKASDAVVGEMINWREAYRSLYWIRQIGPIAAELLDENAAREREGDLWTARQVSLDASDARLAAAEVRIGVWDTGVDPEALGAAMWRNPAELPNGLDDDGNGYVDDLHGISLTDAGKLCAGTLRPLGTLSRPYDQLLDAVIAEADISRGVENAGTLAFKGLLGSLSVPERMAFDEERGRVAQFVHGTHVASIAVAGNPSARVVAVAYGSAEEGAEEPAPTRESVIAEAESHRTTIAYFRAQGVRVVTMSWLMSVNGLEAELERHGVGESAVERSGLAREWFREHRSRLEAAIAESPGMLFVCGAGNFADDVDFAEYIPAGLDLPNLVTVGAVDVLDRPTSFTSSGRGVWLYANGSNVAGLVPGGRTAVFSGTSAAVPQVANLAAKMLALRPELTPEEIIGTLRATGAPVAGLPNARSIDPKRAIGRVRGGG